MAKEVIMPALGMDMATGKIVTWLKQEGETVTAGDLLVEIETDKTNVEIEAPVTGVVTSIAAKEGDEVPVGQRIAVISEPGDGAEAETGEK